MLQTVSLSALNKHVAVPGLDRNDVYKKELLVPNHDDQKRIAIVLDKIDALRHQRQESLELTEMLLQSVFIDTFGDPVTNPKAWPLEPLARLGTLDRGVSKHRPRNAPELLGGKYPLVQTGDVSNAGLYIRKYTQSYSDIGLKQSKMWPKGTLCITIAANIAKTGILNFDACFPDSIVGFTPYKNVSSSVYVHYLFGFLQAMLEANAPQAAQKNINLAILRTLQVPKPPLDLQEEFDVFVTSAMAMLDDQGTSLEVMNAAFSSLQQRAFRGELNLSRVVLDSAGDPPYAPGPEKPGTKKTDSMLPMPFLRAAHATEAALKKLDTIVSKGEQIPWSADYFKYRVLGAFPAPFSFGEVMQKAEAVFDAPPPYEEIKDMILNMLEQGEGRAHLEQKFDLHIDAKTKEVSGRKEIVFGPPVA
jgi:hypothetical protein